MIYRASDLKVGLFQDERRSRPGPDKRRRKPHILAVRRA